jgi:hypothetical protein
LGCRPHSGISSIEKPISNPLSHILVAGSGGECYISADFRN